MLCWALTPALHLPPGVWLAINQSPVSPQGSARPVRAPARSASQPAGWTMQIFINSMKAINKAPFWNVLFFHLNFCWDKYSTSNFSKLLSGSQQTQTCPVSRVLEILSTVGKARGGWKLGPWRTSTSRPLGRVLLFTMYHTCHFTPWLAKFIFNPNQHLWQKLVTM